MSKTHLTGTTTIYILGFKIILCLDRVFEEHWIQIDQRNCEKKEVLGSLMPRQGACA